MDITLLSRLETLNQRHGDIAARLNEPTVTNDMNSYRALTKEHADLDILICLYRQWQYAQDDFNTAKLMSEESQTLELREFATEEIKIANNRMHDAVSKALYFSNNRC